MKLENGNQKQKQQGDVLLVKVNVVPSNAKRVERNIRGFVLAEGEVTGHAHVIDDDIQMFEDGTGNLFVSTEKPVTIRHEEHGPIQLDAGIWKVGRVREYDYIAEAARFVAD